MKSLAQEISNCRLNQGVDYAMSPEEYRATLKLSASIRDLVAICSNCHRTLYRKGFLDWRGLREAVFAAKRAGRV